MALFRNTQHDIDNTLGQGLQEDENALSPYTEYAGQDFDTGRNALYSGLKSREQGPHYDQEYFEKILGSSPGELQNEEMSGFENSPFAKTAQMESKGATSMVQNQENASGMGGSGDEDAIDAQVQNGIMSEEDGDYLKNLHSVLGAQKSALDQFNHGTQGLMKIYQDMLGKEYGAEGQVGNAAMRTSEEQASGMERDNNRGRGILDDVASLGGLGLGLYDVLKKKPSASPSIYMMGDL